jgi:phospholipid/cholesterol/gamma-HCH transport system substrate-binding protein
MLTRTVRIQLLAFVAIALLGVTYVAIRYVGLASWFGNGGYTVRLELPYSGGIFTNAEVTYRGVPVGRVGNMRLTARGIEVDLHVTSGRKIPSDLTAVVADRSVIGEQYVDLIPHTSAAPYLAAGSIITEQHTQLPPPIQDLLLSTDQLAHSVPIGSLQTVVTELYAATRNAGPELQRLIVASKAFFTTAYQHLPQTIDLVQSGRTVLAGQNAESAAIKSFSANLALIGAQLRTSNGDITKILDDSAPALNQVTALVGQLHGSLGALLSNLFVTSDVFLARKDSVQQLLVGLPVAITAGGSILTPNGLNVGVVPTFFDPLPCTAGYQATKVRPGLQAGPGAPLNTAAGCRASAGSGIDVRGAQNAPR